MAYRQQEAESTHSRYSALSKIGGELRGSPFILMKTFKRKIIVKPTTNRDYFAGQALRSLVIRNNECNFSVEAYYVADHMLKDTESKPWKSPTGELREYFAAQVISAVIEASLDKEYKPKDAFEIAEQMLEARKRDYA